MDYIELFNKVSTVLLAIGVLLSFFGLRIGESPIESTYIKGKLKRTAIIEVKRPILLKIGSVLLIIGLISQLIVTLIGWG